MATYKQIETVSSASAWKGSKMKWSELAEQQIRKAQAEGQFDDLEGAGKPLKHRSDNSVDAAAFRIMAEAGVVPHEIKLNKSVDAQRLKLQQTTNIADRKTEMQKLADLELRLAIEQEARRKYYRTA